MAANADYVLHETKGVVESFRLATDMIMDKYVNAGIFHIKKKTEFTEIYNSMESLSGAKKLGEFETPPIVKLNESYQVTETASRYGEGILISEDAMEKMTDQTIQVKEFLEEERERVLIDLELFWAEDVHQFLNEAFSSTNIAAPDGVALCGTHSWKTPGASTWSNNPTNAKVSSSAVDTIIEYGGDFKDAEGKPFPQNFDTVVVKLGSENAREAKRLFAKEISPTSIGDINIYQGGTYKIIETPWITPANKNYWFMFDLRRFKSPLYMGIKRAPYMHKPFIDKNESVRSNVTGYWKKMIRHMPINVVGSQGNA
jgi:hypothetical protein